MIVIVGALIVLCSVIGGFWLAGGNALNLLHLSEFVIICGAGGGALVVMSPRKVLMDLVQDAHGDVERDAAQPGGLR